MRVHASVNFAALLLLSFSTVRCGGDRVPASTAAPVAEAGNSVAAFLKDAERQAETNEQRQTIQRALRDMLEKSPSDLAQARYPDYAGKAGSWSVIQVLQHYFVPNPPAAIDEPKFPQEVRAEAARAAIQHQLDEVTKALQ